MKKKTMWIFFGVITIICVLILSFLYLTWIVHYMPGGVGYAPITIAFNQTVTDDGWSFTVISTSMHSRMEKETFTYILYEGDYSNLSITSWTMLEENTLKSIKGKSSGYGIMWIDNDQDSVLSIGDSIFISKTGGFEGTAKKGDILGIDSSRHGLIVVVELK